MIKLILTLLLTAGAVAQKDINHQQKPSKLIEQALNNTEAIDNVSCNPDGAYCNYDFDCCSNYCSGNFICGGFEEKAKLEKNVSNSRLLLFIQCSPYGSDCNFDFDCCSNYCDSGFRCE